MPAIIAPRALSHLSKRTAAWPSHNRGVMVVFCIIAVLVLMVIALVLHRKLAARRVEKERREFQEGIQSAK